MREHDTHLVRAMAAIEAFHRHDLETVDLMVGGDRDTQMVGRALAHIAYAGINTVAQLAEQPIENALRRTAAQAAFLTAMADER